MGILNIDDAGNVWIGNPSQACETVRILATPGNQNLRVARARGEVFKDIRPADTMVEVSRFIHPEWLVEMEADAVVGD